MDRETERQTESEIKTATDMKPERPVTDIE